MNLKIVSLASDIPGVPGAKVVSWKVAVQLMFLSWRKGFWPSTTIKDAFGVRENRWSVQRLMHRELETIPGGEDAGLLQLWSPSVSFCTAALYMNAYYSIIISAKVPT